ncbi:hypothetical protein WJX73_004794 [Symbiochloris irregularis]|uniref:Uncharacterized protein n=1 Tax=Symbiochloris irregularis TaxID=706552 RepID=A0AAW1NIS2_9CHLO
MGNNLTQLKEHLDSYEPRRGRPRQYPLGFEGAIGELLLVVYGALACAVGVLAGVWDQANNELQTLMGLTKNPLLGVWSSRGGSDGMGRSASSAMNTEPLQNAVPTGHIQDGFAQIRRRVESSEEAADQEPSSSTTPLQLMGNEAPMYSPAYTVTFSQSERPRDINTAPALESSPRGSVHDSAASTSFSRGGSLAAGPLQGHSGMPSMGLRSSGALLGVDSHSTRQIPIQSTTPRARHNPELPTVPSWSAIDSRRASPRNSLRISQELAATAGGYNPMLPSMPQMANAVTSPTGSREGSSETSSGSMEAPQVHINALFQSQAPPGPRRSGSLGSYGSSEIPRMPDPIKMPPMPTMPYYTRTFTSTHGVEE